MKLSILVLTSVALAQTVAEKPKTGRYEGSLTSTAGGPVADARVIVQSGGTTLHAVSGPDGKFVFPSLQPTVYTVRVTRPGFVLATPKKRPSILFQLAAGEVVTDNLTLVPESFVSGRVVDSDGSPVELANVQVMRAAKFQAGRLTNDRGEFRIPALLPGRYLIRVTPNTPHIQREIRTDGTREQQDIPTYYSASTTLEGATLVEVPEGGGATGIEIRLARAPVVQVSGTIAGLEAKAHPSVQLVRGADRVNASFEFKDGKFAFTRLSPGKYTLIASLYAGGKLKSASVPVEITVGDKDLEELELRLEPTVDVELQIQWPTGVTQKTASVTLSAPDRFFVNSNLLTSAGDSGFRIANLGRDRYPVTVYGDKGPVGIKAVQMNGADLPGRLLDLTQGAGPVTIVVASETGEIIGKVEDQKSNAAVALLSDAAGPARLTYASLDSSGAYSFKGLAPGEYKVAVVDERDYPELSAAGSLGVYEVAAKKVTLAGKDTLTVDLE